MRSCCSNLRCWSCLLCTAITPSSQSPFSLHFWKQTLTHYAVFQSLNIFTLKMQPHIFCKEICSHRVSWFLLSLYIKEHHKYWCNFMFFLFALVLQRKIPINSPCVFFKTFNNNNLKCWYLSIFITENVIICTKKPLNLLKPQPTCAKWIWMSMFNYQKHNI